MEGQRTELKIKKCLVKPHLSAWGVQLILKCLRRIFRIPGMNRPKQRKKHDTMFTPQPPRHSLAFSVSFTFLQALRGAVSIGRNENMV